MGSVRRCTEGFLVALCVAWLLAGCGASASPATTPPGVASQRVWAVGYAGTILATTDGGAKWTAQGSLTSNDLYGVTFADALHGWVVGDRGTVLATTDGGAHWSAQNARTAQNLRSVTFVDQLHGWLVGDAGVIRVTSNGGKAWTALHSGITRSLTSVCFSDADHGWASGIRILLATVDGGAHWTVQVPQSVWPGFTGPVFYDNLKGWILGGWYRSRVYATTDGGAHWSEQVVHARFGPYLRAIAFSGPSSGWVVGNEGSIFATVDGGSHWGAQQAGTWQDLLGVAFGDALHGWIVGESDLSSSDIPPEPNGVILATTDGGKHWLKQVNPLNEYLLAVACPRQPTQAPTTQ
jgi:photosystem II stability/assembly factor-like uncharacterized protein